MKKTLFIILLTLSIIFSSWNNVWWSSVILSWVVGSGNHTPKVLSVTPNGNPEILAASSMQDFSISLEDNEQDNITYTITPEASGGSVNPTTGNISSFDSNSGATLNFTYSAPSSGVWDKIITVTLSDGNSVASHNISVYIY